MTAYWGKESVTIYSKGYSDGYDYGWVVIKNGRIAEIGQDCGREGGVYWRRNDPTRDSLTSEAQILAGKWGKDFYVKILTYAYKDAKNLPSPNVADKRYRDRIVKQKETQIRMRERTIRRLRKDIERIQKGR